MGGISKVLRMPDGRRTVIHNTKFKSNWSGSEGYWGKGVWGSLLGGSVIEGFSQLIGDLGLCLSLNQRFWRATAAGFVGLAAGALGTLAVGVAVAFGAPVIVAALIGVGVGMGVSAALNTESLMPNNYTRDDFVDSVGNWAGRY